MFIWSKKITLIKSSSYFTEESFEFHTIMIYFIWHLLYLIQDFEIRKSVFIKQIVILITTLSNRILSERLPALAHLVPARFWFVIIPRGESCNLSVFKMHPGLSAKGTKILKLRLHTWRRLTDLLPVKGLQTFFLNCLSYMFAPKQNIFFLTVESILP